MFIVCSCSDKPTHDFLLCESKRHPSAAQDKINSKSSVIFWMWNPWFEWTQNGRCFNTSAMIAMHQKNLITVAERLETTKSNISLGVWWWQQTRAQLRVKDEVKFLWWQETQVWLNDDVAPHQLNLWISQLPHSVRITTYLSAPVFVSLQTT